MLRKSLSSFQENVSDSGAEKVKIWDRDISNALCSLAEIYLTDCWYDLNSY